MLDETLEYVLHELLIDCTNASLLLLLFVGSFNFSPM